MNSFIIHTLRQRSKLNITGTTNQNRSKEESNKTKHPEKQLYTMLLLVTFAYLTLPIKILEIYLIFDSGNTPTYYAALQLFYQLSGKLYYTNHGINFFLYVMSGHKFRSDLKNFFITKERMDNGNTGSNISTVRSTIPMNSSFIS